MRTVRFINALLVLTLVAATGRTAAARDLPGRLPAAAPGEVGMDAAALEKIAPRMQEFVDKGEAAGIVTLVAREGRVVHEGAVGMANIEAKRPMTADTLFCIASMTKPVTATAVMILVDEGKLGIDDPVEKLLPSFAEAKLKSGEKPARAITLRDLMTHTSGLGGTQEMKGTLAETAEAISRYPLDFEPGTKWQYSPGLTVCGRVVEVVSGMPYEKFLEERIFAPLQMKDTTFHPSAEQQERLAQLYEPGEEKGMLKPLAHWLLNVKPDATPNPSGGLFSTARDMARFYQMVLNDGELDGQRIVSAEAVREMTSLKTDELTTGFTGGNGWGLGWCLVREPQGVTERLSSGTFGHGGAFGTQGWVDPQRKMIFVLMLQRSNFGNSDGSEIRGALQELGVDAVR